MPSVPHILRLRRRRRDSHERSFSTRSGQIGLGCSALLGIAFAISLVLLTTSYALLARDLPNPETLPHLLEPPDGLLLNPTRIYDRSGVHLILSLEDEAVSRNEYLTFTGSASESIPEHLVNATIAISEPQLWSGFGFSLRGLLQGSHPTLAQRLTANLLLWDEPAGLRRSLRERLLAAQITARFGREKILEWYLNSADYGRLAYGADAAARLYLDKPAARLTLAEAALLAAVSETPALNPLDAPVTAFERQKAVLQAMFGRGDITAEEYLSASEEEISVRQAVDPLDDLAPAFTNLVLEDLAQIFGRDRILRGGLSITTTLDYNLQVQALCTRDSQIARLSPEDNSRDAMRETGTCPAARLLPTLPPTSRLTESSLQASVIVLDPRTGQLLAMVGSPQTGFDPAHLPGQPPGTLLTPITYLAGFTRGYNPASLVWDIPTGLPENAVAELSPTGDYLGPMRLRAALANDRLIPAARLFLQMGPANVLRTAQQLGLHFLTFSEDRPSYDLFLDGGEVTLLELSQTYGVFANQGLLSGQSVTNSNQTAPAIEPITVLSVVNDWGETLLDCQGLRLNCQPQTQPVISAQLAYLITDILSDEAARWPSLGHPNPLEIGRPAGTKIGQVAGNRQAWTVGYTPEFVVGVWAGLDDAASEDVLSPQWAAGLWHAVIQFASQSIPATDWPVPAGINTIVVCDPSGLLPTSDCPALVNDVFPSGSEPTQADTLFQRFQINRETGRLATIFTPPELIDEQVFMVVPPEAAEWAQDAGLPTPPESYDILFTQTTGDKDVYITSPGMFAKVNGEVTIRGHAAGQGFDSYRVQIGEGLNPTAWLQLGEDVQTPVNDGLLAVWDTRGLSGLYALQLLVVDENQDVNTTTVQITVDNQPPEIAIRYPDEGQRFELSPDDSLTFQVDASDDLGLATVEFYLDGKRLVSLNAPPFAFAWQESPGDHTLRVEAIDEAGNASEATRNFMIER